MYNFEDNIIFVKSKKFALRIIKIYKYLNSEKKEFVLSKQLLRSGTSIGANISEGIRAQSRPDFIAKLSISLKEAQESLYWLELLKESDYITSETFISVHNECTELIKLLVTIIKSTRNKNP